MTDDAHPAEPTATETIEELRHSFSYGSRSNLDFKFVKALSDDEFGDFLEELLAAVPVAADTGDSSPVADVARRWQTRAYSDKVDPADFRYRHDDVPFTPMGKPLAESRLLVLTSSGHFVAGDDPMPLGVADMSQAEAERRVSEFMKERPALSRIPIDTPADALRARHPGYPVAAANEDPQVVLPLGHLRDLVDAGVIGELVEDAFSFVGAAPQGLMRSTIGPEWAEMANDLGADAALLVPI